MKLLAIVVHHTAAGPIRRAIIEMEEHELEDVTAVAEAAGDSAERTNWRSVLYKFVQVVRQVTGVQATRVSVEGVAKVPPDRAQGDSILRSARVESLDFGAASQPKRDGS